MTKTVSINLGTSANSSKASNRDSVRRLEDGSIDAGLHLLTQFAKPGQSFSHTEISIACGCHRGYISLIEKAALRKLRRKLGRNSVRLEREELRAHLR